jgi:hypothetical protein
MDTRAHLLHALEPLTRSHGLHATPAGRFQNLETVIYGRLDARGVIDLKPKYC